MNSQKTNKSLDELIRYLHSCPIIVEPRNGVSLERIINEIKDIGGTMKGVYFGNTLRIELPLKSLRKLEKSKNIKKFRFDGDYNLLRGIVSEQESKLDNYLTELLSFIDSTPILVQTIDGLKEEDEVKIEELGGMIPDNLRILATSQDYVATLPLDKIKKLAEFSRVKRVWYDQPLHGLNTTVRRLREYKGR